MLLHISSRDGGVKSGVQHTKHKFGLHSNFHCDCTNQYVDLLMALLQVVWVTMPLIMALLQCGKSLFVLRGPILNGMLGTIRLGYVETMVWKIWLSIQMKNMTIHFM
jgi:hypothetical protein